MRRTWRTLLIRRTSWTGPRSADYYLTTTAENPRGVAAPMPLRLSASASAGQIFPAEPPLLSRGDMIYCLSCGKISAVSFAWLEKLFYIIIPLPLVKRRRFFCSRRLLDRTTGGGERSWRGPSVAGMQEGAAERAERWNNFRQKREIFPILSKDLARFFGCSGKFRLVFSVCLW